MGRKKIESCILFLQKDLKLADRCQATRQNIVRYINGPYFSKELAQYFKQDIDDAKPFIISSTDPTQVAVFKKILNALADAANALRAVETVDIGRERFALGVYKDAAKIGYKAIHELYAAIQLLNSSGPEIQTILSPHWQTLLPRLNLALDSLKAYTPKGQQLEANVGAKFAVAIKMLPDELPTPHQGLENFNHLLFDLPNHFKKIQEFITTFSFDVLKKESVTTEEYQAAILKKANALQKNFENLTRKNGLGLLPSYLSTMKQLVSLGADIVNAGAPLTKAAYIKATETLNTIRHSLLPELIAEIETLEESLCLKPGVLTDPLLDQMNEYYGKLALQVERIAEAAGVLDTVTTYENSSIGKLVRFLTGSNKIDAGKPLKKTPHLNIMMDNGFANKRKELQVKRLSREQFISHDQSTLQAAQRFFDAIASRTGWFTRTQTLDKLKNSEKEQLIQEYKQFQSHFAALYPDLDKLVVTSLNGNFARWKMSLEMKQLFWGGSQFNKILACKERILADIQQSMAQALFKEKLVKKTIKHAHIMHYRANRAETLLSTETAPFIAQSIKIDPETSAAQYHEKALAMASQLHFLLEAKDGLTDFFSFLSKEKKSLQLYQLNGECKEVLRSAYKKFQAHIVNLNPALDAQIVHELSNNSPAKPSSSRQEISALAGNLSLSIETLIAHSRQDIEDYSLLKQQAKLNEQQRTPLVENSHEHLKKTLFGIIHELKLSRNVDTFFHQTIVPFLKENLSASVWKELSINGEIDETKLPFVALYQDAQQIVFYKQLINSFYHLKKSLATLEALQNYGDPSSTLQRSRYLVDALNGLVVDIYKTQSYLRQVAEERKLRLLIKKGLDILEPLQSLPVVGNFLKLPPEKTKALTKTEDIVTLWKNQQQLIAPALGVVFENNEVGEVIDDENPLADAPANPDESASSNEAITLKEIMEKLYNIPHTEVSKAITEFLASLSELRFGPKSLKSLLINVNNLNLQLSLIGQESRHYVIDNIKKIRSDLGAEIIGAADNTEFHLGLKPGTLSDPIRERFDAFYASLVTHLPLSLTSKPHEDDTHDQLSFGLLIDSSVTEKRLAKEQKRLQKNQLNDDAKSLKTLLFTSQHPHFDSIHEAYDQLRDLNESESLLANKENIQAIYSSLYPYLIQLKNDKGEAEFPIDFISRLNDELALNEALDNLLDVQGIVAYCPGLYDQIDDLDLWNTDFSKQENRETFLRIYDALQPHLYKIDSQYDRHYFLRKLESPAAFTKVVHTILTLKDKLEQLVAGREQSQQLKLALCHERIQHLSAYQQREKEATTIKIEAFKDKVYNNHLKANIKSGIEKTIGQPYSDIFFAHVLPDFTALKQIILNDLSMDDPIEDTIAERLDLFAQNLLENNEFKAAYLLLKEDLNTLQTLFHKETTEFAKEKYLGLGNPLREEKIKQLQERMVNLENIALLNPLPLLEDVTKKHQEMVIFHKKLARHEPLIKVYEQLNTMKHYLIHESNTDCKEKVDEIKAMQSILCEEKPVDSRVRALKTYCRSPKCQEIIHKDQDNAFIRFFKTLASLLFNIQSTPIKLFTRFRTKLDEINVEEESELTDESPITRFDNL